MRTGLALGVAAAALSGGCGGCGGDDGPAADGGGFVLVSRVPEADADDVYVFDPIILTFSRPVDPDSVTDATVVLEAAGAPVARDAGISDDGTVVTLVVTEPPATPAEVTVTVNAGLRDTEGASFAGESWSYRLPVWQHPEPAGEIAEGGAPQLVLGADGAPVVGWIDGGGAVVVRRLDGAVWADLGPLGGAAADVRLASDGVAVTAAILGDGGVTVVRSAGDGWEELGTVATDGNGARPVFDVGVDGDGNPVVAVFTGSAVQLSRWDGSSLVAEAPLEAVAAVRELALAPDGQRIVIALVSGAGVLRTFWKTQAGWEELAGGIDPNAAERPDVAAATGTIAVSWQKDDAGPLGSRHLYAAWWSGTGWVRIGHAADLDIQADAVDGSIARQGTGAIVAWSEGDERSRKVYAASAEQDSENWTFFDSALNSDPDLDATRPSLALDPRGHPVAAFAEEGRVVVARWNGSFGRRRPLPARLPAGDCAIPEDSPPATLAETGCYTSVPGHALAPQLIPFAISSPLWSDGAFKRRFLLLPDGQAMVWSDTAALTMPVGTLLVKEFWLERAAGDPTSRFPVETRFLVKRCEEGDCLEPWQGYSYRWREDGGEADLIDPGSADERTDWTVTDESGTEIVHTHIYPARLNCTRCHSAAAGRVLGLQGRQLDRPASYGGLLAGQVEAMVEMGLLTSAVFPDEVARLPSSLDPSYDYQSRSRAYYQANCAHCHRPGGERPTIDFRFEAPLAAGNICDKLTPGDGDGSLLYTRDATRGAGQMPPLASDAADDYQLATTAAWIDGMSSCP